MGLFRNIFKARDKPENEIPGSNYSFSLVAPQGAGRLMNLMNLMNMEEHRGKAQGDSPLVLFK